MSGGRIKFPAIPGIEIVGVLGSGGMGDVLLARKLGAHGFDRFVAVKVIRTDWEDSQGQALFRDEARLLARMDHPVIAQVYDFDQNEDHLYLVMEYLAGLTFRDLIRDRTIPLDPRVCARLCTEACWGLHAAHEVSDRAGRSLAVVHRDVTPENLILTFNGCVKILDFGIALMRERTAPVTQVGMVRGKPAYLAPEQRTGRPIDRRTDIYGVSLVLYELLTGKPVFPRGVVLDEQIKLRMFDVPRPVSEAGPLPNGLEEIVMRGLAPDPDDRFSSAREMALALEDTLAVAGGQSLQAFAERHLVEHRAERDREIRVLLGEPERAVVPRREPTEVVGAPPPEKTRPLPQEPSLPPDPPRRKPLIWAGAAALIAMLVAIGAIDRSAPELAGDEAAVVEAAPLPRAVEEAGEPEGALGEDEAIDGEAIDDDELAGSRPPSARPPKKKRIRPPARSKKRYVNGIITRW